MNKTIIKFNDKEVYCYGKMSLEQNVNVTCTDEFEDKIVSNGFNSWQEAVEILSTSGYFKSGIKQLEVI